MLAWDRTGYVVVHKRLERGTLRVPVAPRAGQQHVDVDAGELMLMLEGLRSPQRPSAADLLLVAPRAAPHCDRAAS